MSEAGLTDDLTYHHIVGATKYILAQPVMRALWADYRRAFAPELWPVIDDLIATTPLAKAVDLTAQLKARLAEITATA